MVYLNWRFFITDSYFLIDWNVHIFMLMLQLSLSFTLYLNINCDIWMNISHILVRNIFYDNYMHVFIRQYINENMYYETSDFPVYLISLSNYYLKATHHLWLERVRFCMFWEYWGYRSPSRRTRPDNRPLSCIWNTVG